MKSQTNVMGVPGVGPLPMAVAEEAADKLLETYLPWLERALEGLPQELVWRRPRPEVNSIGNLLLHLNGNVRQWLLAGLGGREDDRAREAEFAAQEGPEGLILFGQLRDTVLEACKVIRQARGDTDWLTPITIQGFKTTPLGAVLHVVEHFSYHTGQIVLLAKTATGRDMGFYDLD